MDNGTRQRVFAQLYTQHRPQIEKRLHRLLCAYPDLMQDAQQMVWLKVWKYLPTCPKPQYAWVYTIAKHVVIDMVRYERNRMHDSLDRCIQDDDGHSIETVGNELEDLTVNIEKQTMQREEIREQLGILTKQERLYLLLWQEGYTVEEVTNLLHIRGYPCSSSAVRSGIRRARDKTRGTRRREEKKEELVNKR